MKCINADFESFIDKTSKKRVVAFGATGFLQVMAENYPELGLPENISYIVDNDIKKDKKKEKKNPLRGTMVLHKTLHEQPTISFSMPPPLHIPQINETKAFKIGNEIQAPSVSSPVIKASAFKMTDSKRVSFQPEFELLP